MKMKRLATRASLCLIACILVFLIFWWLQPKPLYEQMNRAVTKADLDNRELLHIHVDQERTLAFYLTSKSELGIVLLQEKFHGFKVKDYIQKGLLETDKALSWQGASLSQQNIHLLYGFVQDPEITQVIIISQENKVAHLITQGSHTLWYLLADKSLNNPITIRATNREGKIVYETGDPEFWRDKG